MAPNTREETDNKRRGEDWSGTPYETPTYFEDELEKIISNGIKVNGFYLDSFFSSAQSSFEDIAARTSGKSAQLLIDDERGADQLIDLLSEIMMRAVSKGDVSKGDELVQVYREMFGRGFTLD